MRPLLLLTVLVLLLSGCASRSEPVTTANRVSTPATPSPTLAANESANLTVPQEVPLLWDGTVGGYVAGCALVGEGYCVSVPLGPWEPQTHRLAAANYTRASLTVTWNPVTPATNELQIAFFNITKKEDGSEGWYRITEWTRGTSPLTFDTAVPPLEPGQEAGLIVLQPNLAPDPLLLLANTDQPFHVEGTIIKQVPADEG